MSPSLLRGFREFRFSSDLFAPTDTFTARHLGPLPHDVEEMCKARERTFLFLQAPHPGPLSADVCIFQLGLDQVSLPSQQEVRGFVCLDFQWPNATCLYVEGGRAPLQSQPLEKGRPFPHRCRAFEDLLHANRGWLPYGWQWFLCKWSLCRTLARGLF